MEIKPVHVTFEQAQLLKEKGFSCDCFYFYDFIGYPGSGLKPINWNESKEKLYSRPEQWQVVEWLRIKYDIWVYVRNFETLSFCAYILKKGDLEKSILNSDKGFSLPQKAYSAAFDYIFNTLIKEEEIK